MLLFINCLHFTLEIICPLCITLQTTFSAEKEIALRKNVILYWLINFSFLFFREFLFNYDKWLFFWLIKSFLGYWLISPRFMGALFLYSKIERQTELFAFNQKFNDYFDKFMIYQNFNFRDDSKDKSH